MAGAGWKTCSQWQDDAVLEPMVVSFLHHCPVQECLPQDCPRPQPADLDVHQYVISFVNHVIRIRLKGRHDIGFVLKRTPPSQQGYVPQTSLPEERGQMEYKAYGFFNTLVPGCCPSPLFYDKSRRILCTLELMEHQPLSGAVLTGQFKESGARALAATLASIHAATHVITVGSLGLEEQRQQFPTRESMMTLIRTYHFERPFDPSDPGRRCHESVLRMLPEILGDAAVLAARDEAKRSFMDDLECVIHGDLHIESVLINGCDIKIIDAEFTRVGPCAYDLSLLLATLLTVFHRYRHVLLGTTQLRHDLTMLEQCDTVAELQDESSNPGPFGSRHHSDKRPEDERGKVRDTLKHFTFEEGDVSRKPFPDGDCLDQRREKVQVTVKPSHDDSTLNNNCSVGNDLPASDILLKCSVLLGDYVDRMGESLHSKPERRVEFQQKLLKDIATFTGCELLAWVIGPPHMDFMDSSPPAQLDCVRTALRLLRNRHCVTCVEDFVKILSTTELTH